MNLASRCARQKTHEGHFQFPIACRISFRRSMRKRLDLEVEEGEGFEVIAKGLVWGVRQSL